MSIAHFNRTAAEQITSRLIELGITHCCISPGSRSTPITEALSRSAMTQHLFFDERAAAFFALGVGKASRRPALMVTTSGTAVSNLLPAVTEADAADIPLLIITADRPPELRSTGANQCIDQVNIFAQKVRWFFDIPVPNEQSIGAPLDSILRHAVLLSQNGPVHLNLMIREPFLPEKTEQIKAPYKAIGPLFTPQISCTAKGIDWLRQTLQTARRGLVLAGMIEEPAEQRAAERIIQALGWPVFADITSNIRTAPVLVQPAEALLTHPKIDSLKPDVVLQLGGKMISKRYDHWLSKSQALHIVINSSSKRQDSGNSVHTHIVSQLHTLPNLRGGTSELLPVLHNLQHKLKHCTDKYLETLSEPAIAAVAPTLCRSLFLSSSMPIRDVNRFALSRNCRIGSNRGASGIDGVLSSAAGWAAALQEPTLLLIGDLATIHDLGALLSLRQINPPLVIVAINNHGGAIFSFLPIAQQSEHFETHFATAHQTMLTPIVSAMGIPTSRPTDLGSLIAAIRAGLAQNSLSFIEVITDRSENLKLHTLIQAELHAVIEEEL